MYCRLFADADYLYQRRLADAEHTRVTTSARRHAGTHRMRSPIAVRSAFASLIAAAVILSMTVA